MAAGPAYRIETERLVVRAYQEGGAPLLKAAVDASIPHLRPWMPWASAEPQTLEEKVVLCRRFREAFDAREDFAYAILDPDETRLVGSTGLHLRRGPRAREIGYWLAADELGRGYATEITAALTRVAFEVDEVDHVEIRVDPANERSLAIPRRLGFSELRIIHGDITDAEGRPRDTVVFALLARDYPFTPSAAARALAFDERGREIFLTGG